MSPLALFALAGAAVQLAASSPETVGVGPRAAEEFQVANFSSLHVATRLSVRVVTGNAHRVTAGAHGSIVASVDSFGALHLACSRGRRCRGAVVDVTVPQPLVLISASSRAQVAADKAAGPLSASSRSLIRVDVLEAGSVSLLASSRSDIAVGSGRVDSVSAGISSLSQMDLGKLNANSAAVYTSAQSDFSGLVAKKVMVSVSSSSWVSIAAAQELAYSCSSASDLTLPPEARVTVLLHHRSCRINTRKERSAQILP